MAPELGVLAALDATLATAAYQLLAEHADLAPDVLARGHLPDPLARRAHRLIGRLYELRAQLRAYRDAALGSRDRGPDF